MRLTLPQHDVYVEQLLYPDQPIYNIGAKIKIQGKIDVNSFRRAYQQLIAQHDAFRGHVQYAQGEVCFDIKPTHDAILKVVDFSKDSDPIGLSEQYMQEQFKIPFDLHANSPLYNFILIKVGYELYYLFSMYHHIITDGWGTSLMFQRLVQNYNEIIETGDVSTKYPFRYEEFSMDDESYQHSEYFERDELYWKSRFTDLPDSLLPRKDEQASIIKSKRKRLVIKRSHYNQLAAMAAHLRCSTFHAMLGVFYLYLGRRYQNLDFAIGIPVLNRGKKTFKKTVGLFMGVSALRIHLNMHDTFKALLLKIKSQLLADYRHQRFSIGKLNRVLGLSNTQQRLFDVTLSYEKQDYAAHFKDTCTSVIPLTHESERVGLAIYVREFDPDEDVTLDFDYNENYFDEDAMALLTDHVERLLYAVNQDPEKRLFEYDYLSLRERTQLLTTFNQTNVTYPPYATLLDMITARAEEWPDKVVLSDGQIAFTYRDLERMASNVADYLLTNVGVDKHLPIAVLAPRSAPLVVIMLGIMKAGCSFIPLDPGFPESRIKYILHHSQAACIVATSAFRHLVDNDQCFIAMDQLLRYVPENHPQVEHVGASDSAYIIYTSGSTGNPKGVEIGHRSLLNFLLHIVRDPGLGSADVLYSVTTQSFDISILEFFAPLIAGARLYVAQGDVLASPPLMIASIEEVSPTVMQATPGFFQMLFDAGWAGSPGLKILCGGDVLTETLAAHLLDHCREVWNMYGPTETTIWSSSKRLTSKEDAGNIGKPFRNTSFYVLDDAMQLLPVGASGNLYIGGDGLAKGYYKDSPLTARQFKSNPFNSGDRIYHTGDIGRWTSEGEIEFLGRGDNQVKIRGYRVELAEIENTLLSLDMLQGAVVVARRNSRQEAFLVAYVITRDRPLDDAAVKARLRDFLPEYMVPHVMICVDHFPYTPNQKIDRKALTLRDLPLANPTDETVHKPRSVMEENLVCCFQEILEIKQTVGIHDNFFSLGGHSLMAVRLVGLIDSKLQYQILLKDIFDYPTVATLANRLVHGGIRTDRPVVLLSKQEDYAVTQAQYVIWLACLQTNRSIAYNMFRAYTIAGQIQEKLLTDVLVSMIRDYEILRTNFVDRRGGPRQIIHSRESVDFVVSIFTGQEGAGNAALAEYANTPFDLASERLLRAALFMKPDGTAILVFVTHHIIMDGWSLEILTHELVGRYRATLSGELSERRVLPFQFKDYAAWLLDSANANVSTNRYFWQNYLQGYSWQPLIEYDRMPAMPLQTGAFFHFSWDASLLARLKLIASRDQVTLHTFLVAAFNLLIFKLRGHNDICVGTINSGRTSSHLHQQIGMFVKTLPLRMHIADGQCVGEVIRKVQEGLLMIDSHQDIPAEVLATIRLEAIVVLQNPTFDAQRIHLHHQLSLTSLPIDAVHSRLPLLIDFSVSQDALYGVVHFDTTKYNRDTIEIMMVQYKRVLEQIATDGNLSVEALDVELVVPSRDKIEIDFTF